MRALFVTPEIYPLTKVGGLADVAASLPRALRKLGVDVRIVMPWYRAAFDNFSSSTLCLRPFVPGLAGTVEIRRSTMPDTDIPLYLVDAPAYFGDAISPYSNPNESTARFEGERWLAFGYAVTALAMSGAQGWRPQIVHCNDWTGGFVHALLARWSPRPATVFTIHNLAYHGVIDGQVIRDHGLPNNWWHAEAFEFFGKFALLKGGLVWSDRITTVSERYAAEILLPSHGCGLEGLLCHRRHELTGILNGADYEVWNPNRDIHLAQHYSEHALDGKAVCKRTVQTRFSLNSETQPLLGFIGRLVEQKGVDLLIDALPSLIAKGAQIAVLGAGEPRFEQALRDLALRFPGQLGVRIGYDEALAHQIEAGADMFVMPSRYEPCGLNQIYSLRYATPPIVNPTGGLADTVVDTCENSLKNKQATGFWMTTPTADSVIEAVTRAMDYWRDSGRWRQIQLTGMQQDFSWRVSAQKYQALYSQLCMKNEDAEQSQQVAA